MQVRLVRLNPRDQNARFELALAYFALGNNSLPFGEPIGVGRQPEEGSFSSGAVKAVTRDCMREKINLYSMGCGVYELEAYETSAGSVTVDVHSYGAVLATALDEAYKIFLKGENYTDAQPRLTSGNELKRLLEGTRQYFRSLPDAPNGNFYLTSLFAYATEFGISGMNTAGQTALCNVYTTRFPFVMTPETSVSQIANEQYNLYMLLDKTNGIMGNLSCFDRPSLSSGYDTAGGIAYRVSGTVSGLSGTVTLQNNAGDDLAVSADGAFTMPSVVPHNKPYSVTVKTQPSGQTCSVTNGSATQTLQHITDVQVNCI